MNITAKELCWNHLGKPVTFKFASTEFTGTILGIEMASSTIEEQAICESKPRLEVVLPRNIALEFFDQETGERMTAALRPDAPITIQEGQ